MSETEPRAPLDNFGDRVRYARELRRMTQKQLGRALRKTETTISRIEQGYTRFMMPETVQQLARTLDVTLLWLHTGDRELAPMPWLIEPQEQLAKAADPKLPQHVPLPIVRMLCRGTVGMVSDTELRALVQHYEQNVSRGPSFVSENTLELELWAIRFARAEKGSPKIAIAEAFSAAYTRIRPESDPLLEVTE